MNKQIINKLITVIPKFMKLWEITHIMDGVTMVERVEAGSKMEARGVLVRHYLRQLDLVSVVEVEGEDA